jgi:hypothetical protein
VVESPCATDAGKDGIMVTLNTAETRVVNIALRIPGPWKELRELQRRLSNGIAIRQDQLVLPDGRAAWLDLRKADREFPKIFTTSCRREGSRTQSVNLKTYRTQLCLVGPGGSMDAARDMLELGAAVLRAGGLGAFIDNGLVAHWRADWHELCQHRSDPDAVFYTYVNMAHCPPDYFSCGMHALGYRDAIITTGDALPLALEALEDFLRATCRSDPQWQKDEIFASESGGRYRLTPEEYVVPYTPFVKKDHPSINPFGRWRLTPLQNNRP